MMSDGLGSPLRFLRQPWHGLSAVPDSGWSARFSRPTELG